MFSRRPYARMNRGRVRRATDSLWVPPGAGASLALYLPFPTATQYWDPGSAGGLLRWHDLSGDDVQATQPVVGMQPAFEAEGFNGRPCFRWTAASNTHLLANAVATLASGTKTPWVIAELMETFSGTTGATFAFGSGSDADPIHTIQTPDVGGTNKLRSFRRNSAGTDSSDSDSTSNIPHTAKAMIYEFDGANDVLRVYLNDASSAWDTLVADTTGALTLTNLVLGAQLNLTTLSQPLNQRKRAFLMWSGIGSLETIGVGAREAVMTQLVAEGGITP